MVLRCGLAGYVLVIRCTAAETTGAQLYETGRTVSEKEVDISIASHSRSDSCLSSYCGKSLLCVDDAKVYGLTC